MSYAEQALGAPIRAVGGTRPGDYDRREDTQALYDLGRLLGRGDDERYSPKFVIEPPRLVNERFGLWTTTVRYDFNPKRPWLPDQIVDRLEEIYPEAIEPHLRAPRVRVVYTNLLVTDQNVAPFPEPGEPNWNERLREAYEKARERVNTFVTTDIFDTDRPDFAGLRRILGRDDQYDTRDEAELLFGNRLSRIEITFKEKRVPAGNGVNEDLGLERNTVRDFCTETLCGQACLAYVVNERPETMRKRPVTALNKARALGREIGCEGEMGLEELQRFVDFYSQHPDPRRRREYRVIVMRDRASKLYLTVPRSPLYTRIYLYLHQGHFCLIQNIQKFIRPTEYTRKHWCEYCYRIIDGRTKRTHACEGSCESCGHGFRNDAERQEHYAEVDRDRCPRCNFRYGFRACRPYHPCRRWLCLRCNGIYPMERKEIHECGEKKCRHCGAFVNKKHRCFIPRLRRPAEHRAEIWAYDIESLLDPAAGDRTTHTIGVIVATKLYTRETVVFRYAPREDAHEVPPRTTLRGPDVGALFIRWVNRARRPATLVAHNASGYDTWLLFQAAKRVGDVYPTRITAVGRKIISMKINQVTFYDSMRHVQGSLERLAATFGLPEALLRKDFFPYRLYTSAGRGYAGAVPPHEWFDVDPTDAGYLEWRRRLVAELGGEDYVLEDECIKYCQKDVEILAAALEKYRDEAIGMNGVDPLSKATIASYAQAVYRTNFMPEGSLCVLDRAEYEFCRRGFHGGRTEIRQIRRSWTPGDVARGNYARYVDVVSLYPTVQHEDPLPAGAPRWEDLAGADPAAAVRRIHAAGELALIECAYDPPKDLFHPLLVRSRRLTRRITVNGREKRVVQDALVPDLEDVEDAVVTSLEIEKALALGYRFRLRKALVLGARRDLFASYVDTYVRIKIDNSGPGGNPGRKALAKMMLNSLWGKFAQRDADSRMVVYDDPAKWFRDVEMENRGAVDLDVLEQTPAYLLARKTWADRETLHLGTTNLALAAFVTANARLRLYAGLEVVGERAMYMDTDSIIYERVPGAPDVPVGDALGEWSLENAGPGGAEDPIVEWAGIATKTYAYRTAGGKEETRCKGFPSRTFTFDDYDELIRAAFGGGGATEKVTPPLLHFERTPDGIQTRHDYVKKMVFSVAKVQIVSPERTVPYGYVRN